MWKVYLLKIFLLSFLVCSGVSSGAQEVSQNKKAVKAYEAARLLYRTRNYPAVLKMLEQAQKYDDGFAELYFLRADAYQKLGNVSEEMQAIRRGLALDSLSYPAYYFFLAERYFQQGNYESARENFHYYLERDKHLNYEVHARKQLANCEFAIRALQDGTSEQPELFIQSDHPVYWPSLDIDGKTVLYTRLDGEVENIWLRQEEGDLPLNLNTFCNEGTQSLTADGQMMYFTGCNREDSRGSCDLYVAYRLSDTLWSEPVNLGEPINTEAWEAQPSVSADGTRLFFASNREGGKGGSDIWYSVLVRREKDGRQVWSRPRNLYFNTSGEEMAPFLYYDGKVLFFASDAYPGMGGMDIYKVNLDSIDEPKNIGPMVNTWKNEMGFAVDASGKRGYFASDRSGIKNIYRYCLEEPVVCQEMAYILFVTEDEAGASLVPDNLVVVSLDAGDTLAYYDEVYATSPMLACMPAHRFLLVSVLKAGYMYYSDTISVGEADYEHPLTRKLVLRKIRENESLVLKGIFFDVDSHTLRPESATELKQLMFFLKQNPGVEIEISGHTDATGSDTRNQQLSEDRAFEVYKYLFLQRIPKERMSYKGYGKQKPVAPNDTEEGRALNRRTEIRIKNYNR